MVVVDMKNPDAAYFDLYKKEEYAQPYVIGAYITLKKIKLPKKKILFGRVK